MAKPTTKPGWDPSDPLDIVAPSGSKKTTGWQPEEKPPAENFNWFWQLVSEWIDWFDQFVGDYYTVGTGGDYADVNAAIADSKTKIRLIEDLIVTSLQDISLDNVILDFNGFKIGTTTNSLAGVLELSGDNIKLKNAYVYAAHSSGTNTAILVVSGDYCKVNGCRVENNAAGTSTTGVVISGSNNNFDGIILQNAGTITNKVTNSSTGNIVQFTDIINLISNGDFYTGGGSANTYTATSVAPRLGISALENGIQIRFVVPATNTSASTLNVNSLGAKSIKKWDGSSLIAGDLVNGEEVTVRYNLGSDEWRIVDAISHIELNTPTINGKKEGFSTKSSDYVITDNDNLSTIYVDDTSSDRTVTLPTVADNSGRIITIKNTSSDQGKVTVDGEGAETIDGQTTIILDAKYSYVKVQSDGSEWHILDWDIPEKQYSLTIGGTNVTGAPRAVGVPYRNDIRETTWRLKFNIVVTVSSGSRTTQGFTITGVVFKATANFYQQIIGNTISSASAYHVNSTVNQAANSGGAVHASATTTEYGWSGDVELDAKPSFVE